MTNVVYVSLPGRTFAFTIPIPSAMKPSQVYLSALLTALRVPSYPKVSRADFQQWWSGPFTDACRQYGIDRNTREYKEIVEACKKIVDRGIKNV